ncbi:hypothetical protein ACN47E_001010 [Coniothyrium glycines]
MLSSIITSHQPLLESASSKRTDLLASQAGTFSNMTYHTHALSIANSSEPGLNIPQPFQQYQLPPPVSYFNRREMSKLRCTSVLESHRPSELEDIVEIQTQHVVRMNDGAIIDSHQFNPNFGLIIRSLTAVLGTHVISFEPNSSGVLTSGQKPTRAATDVPSRIAINSTFGHIDAIVEGSGPDQGLVARSGLIFHHPVPTERISPNGINEHKTVFRPCASDHQEGIVVFKRGSYKQSSPDSSDSTITPRSWNAFDSKTLLPTHLQPDRNTISALHDSSSKHEDNSAMCDRDVNERPPSSSSSASTVASESWNPYDPETLSPLAKLESESALCVPTSDIYMDTYIEQNSSSKVVNEEVSGKQTNDRADVLQAGPKSGVEVVDYAFDRAAAQQTQYPSFASSPDAEILPDRAPSSEQSSDLDEPILTITLYGEVINVKNSTSARGAVPSSPEAPSELTMLPAKTYDPKQPTPNSGHAPHHNGTIKVPPVNASPTPGPAPAPGPSKQRLHTHILTLLHRVTNSLSHRAAARSGHTPVPNAPTARPGNPIAKALDRESSNEDMLQVKRGRILRKGKGM